MLHHIHSEQNRAGQSQVWALMREERARLGAGEVDGRRGGRLGAGEVDGRNAFNPSEVCTEDSLLFLMPSCVFASSSYTMLLYYFLNVCLTIVLFDLVGMTQ